MTTLAQVFKGFSMLTFVFICLWSGYLYVPLVVMVLLAIWGLYLQFKGR